MYVKKFFIALVALSLVLGAAAFPVTPAMAATTCTQYHTVLRGETLFSIGVAFGVNWPQLAKINNLANPGKIYAGQRLCVSTTTSGSGGTTVPSGFIPTFTITGVVTDKTVSIKTFNFPAHDTFNVTMGAYGTRGVGGTVVQTVNSKKGGSLTFTFDIPASLAGSKRIAIRLESPTSGFFAYNWFFNNTAGGGSTGGGTTGGAYTGFPTFSISSVVRNTSVTIYGNNFPINDTFNVFMGAMGTRGVGGINVGTYKPTSANFSATFNVPAALQGSKQIAIRLESPTSGFFAFNWFYNSTAP